MPIVDLFSEPYEYVSGKVKFTADRCDLRNGVTVEIEGAVSDEELLQRFAAWLSHHSAVVTLWSHCPVNYQHLTYTLTRK